MTPALKHATDCDWHLDQYDQECTCGAVVYKPLYMQRIEEAIPKSPERELAEVIRRLADAGQKASGEVNGLGAFVPMDIIEERNRLWKKVARAMYDEMFNIEMER